MTPLANACSGLIVAATLGSAKPALVIRRHAKLAAVAIDRHFMDQLRLGDGKMI
jgi:hypothetical protein